MSLQSFINSYIECALWASSHCDEDGNEIAFMDEYDCTFSPELMAETVKDCTAFYEAHKHLWADEPHYRHNECDSDEMAGRDFWLTRNGHGVGFWDRDLRHGDELTALCKVFGEVSLYLELEDDGKTATVYG